MNKIEKKNNYYNISLNFIKKNIKYISYAIILLILLIIIWQLYSFYQNRSVLKLSIDYNDIKSLSSSNDLEKKMNEISKEKGFYGLMASLEIINIKIDNKNFEEAYQDYINILNNNNLDNLYKTLLSINSSYNLIGKVKSDKIQNLLSYYDESIGSFDGYKLEIMYLVNLSQKNQKEANIIYKKIIENKDTPKFIIERVNKINEYYKYK